jgi:colanic acid biosynthesis glycosyl transferase WcaI
MRILFYTMNWYPFEGSSQPAFAAALRSLQEAGHTITILTSIPHRVPGRTEGWEQYRGAFFRRETWEGAEVVGVWTCRPAFLHRFKILVWMLSMVTFCLASLMAGLFVRKKYDIVLTVSHPPIAIGLNSRLIAMVKRCPFVYCLEDIYPDALLKARLIRGGLLFRLLGFLERRIYRKAGRVCVLSESMKANLVAKKIPADKIEIIPHFADMDRFKPLPRDNELACRLGLNNVFVLLYPGSLSFHYGIEEVLGAAERIGDNPNLRWIFIDRGRHRREYRREILDRHLGRVGIIPFQSEEDYPWLLASCDVGLVTLERGFGVYSVPSRLLNLMAAARPILAMAETGSEVSRVVRQADCGLAVEPGDVEGFVKAVGRLSEDRPRCQEMGRRARRFLESEFPRQALCRRYQQVLESCLVSSSEPRRSSPG